MKKGIKHTIHQSISLLIIAVMAMLTFNQSANIHTHQLNDGSIITHAHPYQKTNGNTPSDSHHHNKKEYTFISLLEVLFVAALLAFALWLTPHLYQRCIKVFIHIEKCASKHILGRAPPIY